MRKLAPQPHPRRRIEAVPAPRPVPELGTRRRRRGSLAFLVTVVCSAAAVAIFQIATTELESSRLQAGRLAGVAGRATFAVEPGPAPDPWFPKAGPYDERLGYTRLPALLARLAGAGFEVEAQARLSPTLRKLVDFGLFPPYREKSRAGLRILGSGGSPVFEAAFPQRVYPDFQSIPPLVVESLLFIENRELLDPERPRRNPAVEWDRLGHAVLGKALRAAGLGGDGAGGSTLATQLEKFRHSPGGVTSGPVEKARQIASASLRAYQPGPETLSARRQLVVDYLNSAPFAAVPPQGEVIGLGDGLLAWFGADFGEVNRLLATDAQLASDGDPAARAVAYRQVLALLLSARAPSHYLVTDRAALVARTDAFLDLLAQAGVIDAGLRDAARAVRIEPRMRATSLAALGAPARKLVSPVRSRLLPLLGVDGLYELDRLDLDVHSSLDERAQSAITRHLRDLRDPELAASEGLVGFRLLGEGDPAQVTYSFSLFERGDEWNRLRVQADNLEQPFDVNDGVKLDLGSTAKLRTLATYFEIVADLHARHAGKSPAELAAEPVDPLDHIAIFVLDALRRRPDLSLGELLEAAFERRYSASPWETFFTGGGEHHFRNFDQADDERVLSVRQAFRSSVNLVFVRLMRDVVRHYMFRAPGSSATVLRDVKDPRRAEYLQTFAEQEGTIFLDRFRKRYARTAGPEAIDLLVRGRTPSAKRLAILLRSLRPEVSFEEYAREAQARLGARTPPPETLREVYDAYPPERYRLSDRAYLAGVHPLELFVAGYLNAHPAATRAELLAASGEAREEAYRWLFRTRHRGAQDRRIRGLLVKDAFVEIHRQWRRLGYPFDSLVPSYATAIGSSADRPAALAELAGIIVNGGVRLPATRIDRLHFARGTPYETVASRRPVAGERVMRPEVAALLHAAMQDVVEHGTAVRARQALVGRDGKPIAVGGKTGTGDHRFKTFGEGGQLLSARVVSRTATFVFFIGERFFGVVTAFVDGPEAAEYAFTSSLPVQLFRVLAPDLQPLIDSPAPAPAVPPAVPEPDAPRGELLAAR
jgi:membrane peptidoglycan carboxypeptidase